MAIYAIGDLQGCLVPLRVLLERIKFDQNIDQLWLAGDLVNRGPDSLATLRYIKGLGKAAITVLGNHDLHLLAVATGRRQAKNKDTFAELLAAPDKDELLFWLRHQPIAHKDDSLKTIMTHAGVYINWGPKKVMRHAHELETLLRDDSYPVLLSHLFSDGPFKWKKSLEGWERYRFISHCFTRMRFLSIDGNVDLKWKGAPNSQPSGLIPWFLHPERQCKNWRLVFGHWSTLGYFSKPNLISLDSGCVWGKKLTAVRLDKKDPIFWQVPCDN